MALYGAHDACMPVHAEEETFLGRRMCQWKQVHFDRLA